MSTRRGVLGDGPMTTATGAPARPKPVSAGRGGFGSVLRAEWTKFRTVRGWLESSTRQT